MRKRCLFVILLIAIPFHLSAGLVSISTLNPKGYRVYGTSFGSSPEATMECVHGHCLQDGRVRIPYSTYLWPSKTDAFADIPMTQPRYNYWKGKLFRVSFHLQCTHEEEDLWIRRTLDRLEAQQPLSLIAVEKKFLTQGNLRVHRMTFLSPQGAVVEVERYSLSGRREAPRFVLYNKQVKDEIARQSNPQFTAKPLKVPDYLLGQNPA